MTVRLQEVVSCDFLSRQSVPRYVPYAHFLFLDLTAVQVGNLSLYRFDGFHLIHRLNVHTHNERAFHIQKISQQSGASYSGSDSPEMQAARNFVVNGRYAEARRVLDGMTARNARWYYLSSLANQGLGNSIDALQDARRAGVKKVLAERVNKGEITAEDYKRITGDDYDVA